ncbi:MAG TPA: UMP kinase [Actinomycetota bacterium]|nr:UMP kinase [Actinomycetota bacterium]
MKTEPAPDPRAAPPGARYRRVLLKLSGESFATGNGFGLDLQTIERIARQIRDVQLLGVEVAIVVGGGNIFRGSEGQLHGMDRPTADYMGMLATVINALALRSALESEDVETRVQTAIEMKQIAEPYIRGRALRHLEKGRVVIFAAGTGNPYFTTDTPAVLRALEIEAQAILMGKRVDGVYDDDPMLNSNAKFLPELTYMQVLERDLKVMDATAIALCKNHGIPIHVFNLMKEGNILRIVEGAEIGTVVHEGGQ